MLRESLVASTSVQGQNAPTSYGKDVGIQIYELKPQLTSRSTFKKSSTQSNCLAVSSSHIYAAQADKAVVHVYSRQQNNQEAVVPFPERIRSLGLSNGVEGNAVLVLGTESGRLILWEVSTGRSISTSTSHLQPVTSLACDITSNFILSGSADSNIHVWSLPNTLSFYVPHSTELSGPTALTPLHTLSNHRAPVTSITIGHNSFKNNIAVSVSRDKTALVWEFQTGTLLRTILLPAIPLCLSLDPADRALFVGYEDGTVQVVDFFPKPSLESPLFDPNVRNNPLQPKKSDQWLPPVANIGATNCISLTHDGTILLSGHGSGKILSWDVAKRKYASEVLDLTSPVTNLAILKPSGFLDRNEHPNTVLHNVIKARYDHMLSNGSNQSGSLVPAAYAASIHFTSQINTPKMAANSSTSKATPESSFSAILCHSSFPKSLIAEGLSELSSWNTKSGTQEQFLQSDSNEDIIMLEPSPQDSQITTMTNENAALQEKVNNLEEERKRIWNHIVDLNTLNFQYRKMEAQRQKKKRRRREARLVLEEKERGEWLKKNGVKVDEDEEEHDGGGEADAGAGAGAGAGAKERGDEDDSDVSSTTDEMTESE